MKSFLKKNVITFSGVLPGAIAGFLYWKNVGYVLAPVLFNKIFAGRWLALQSVRQVWLPVAWSAPYSNCSINHRCCLHGNAADENILIVF